MRDIDEIIIHCSATRPEWWEKRTAAEKRDEFRRWHKARGWNDIGYHGIIDRDGTRAHGRLLSFVGAHAKGHNRKSIGLCLVGGHGSDADDSFSDHFTPEQDRALRRWISELKNEFPTIVKVTGHNKYSAKACPGFRVHQWLEDDLSGVHDMMREAKDDFFAGKLLDKTDMEPRASKPEVPPETVEEMMDREAAKAFFGTSPSETPFQDMMASQKAVSTELSDKPFQWKFQQQNNTSAVLGLVGALVDDDDDETDTFAEKTVRLATVLDRLGVDEALWNMLRRMK